MIAKVGAGAQKVKGAAAHFHFHIMKEYCLQSKDPGYQLGEGEPNKLTMHLNSIPIV